MTAHAFGHTRLRFPLTAVSPTSIRESIPPKRKYRVAELLAVFVVVVSQRIVVVIVEIRIAMTAYKRITNK